MLCLEYTRCSITIYRINERIFLKSDFVLKLSGEQIGRPDGVSGLHLLHNYLFQVLRVKDYVTSLVIEI